MIQRTIKIPASITPVALLGAQDAYIKLIEKKYSDIKFVVRGNIIEFSGPENVIATVERLFSELVLILRAGQSLSEEAITRSISMLEEMPHEKPGEVLSLNILSNRGKTIRPKTLNQKHYVDAIDKNTIVFGIGPAGTGKTFITLYNELQDVLDERSPYEKIYIVRSLVATREIGFLPGDHEDKSSLYQIPYKNMVKYMFQLPTDADFEMLYGNLKQQGTISFWSTSFIRGTTLDNAIIIVDEFQNLNFHELDSIITRVGEHSKIMFCGDATQSDLIKTNYQSNNNELTLPNTIKKIWSSNNESNNSLSNLVKLKSVSVARSSYTSVFA